MFPNTIQVFPFSYYYFSLSIFFILKGHFSSAYAQKSYHLKHARLDSIQYKYIWLSSHLDESLSHDLLIMHAAKKPLIFCKGGLITTTKNLSKLTTNNILTSSFIKKIKKPMYYAKHQKKN